MHETNENELVFEPAVRWAGNPNVTLVFQLLSLEITLQVRRIFRPYPNNDIQASVGELDENTTYFPLIFKQNLTRLLSVHELA